MASLGPAMRLHARDAGQEAGEVPGGRYGVPGPPGMPDEIKNLCRLADITSKSLLLQIVRQGDPEKMAALIERIASQGGVTREDVRKAAAKPKPGRPEGVYVQLPAANKAFKLRLSFTQGKAEREEIIEALEGIFSDLRKANRLKRLRRCGLRAAVCGLQLHSRRR